MSKKTYRELSAMHEVRSMTGPLYKHDCNKCIFLFTIDRCDYYVCPYGNPKDKIVSTVIGRRSSDGPDYASGDHIGLLQVARNHLREQGWHFRFTSEQNEISELADFLRARYSSRPEVGNKFRSMLCSEIKAKIKRLRYIRDLMEGVYDE